MSFQLVVGCVWREVPGAASRVAGLGICLVRLRLALHGDLLADTQWNRLNVTLFSDLRDFVERVVRPALPAVEVADVAFARGEVLSRIEGFVLEGIDPNDIHLDPDN